MQKAWLQHVGFKMNIMGWRHSTRATYRRNIKNEAAARHCWAPPILTTTTAPLKKTNRRIFRPATTAA